MSNKNTWIQALKIWNKNNGAWCIPKKGSSDYEQVRRIMRGEAPAKPKPPAPAPKKPPAPAPAPKKPPAPKKKPSPKKKPKTDFEILESMLGFKLKDEDAFERDWLDKYDDGELDLTEPFGEYTHFKLTEKNIQSSDTQISGRGIKFVVDEYRRVLFYSETEDFLNAELGYFDKNGKYIDTYGFEEDIHLKTTKKLEEFYN
jgi:hypothetical protein